MAAFSRTFTLALALAVLTGLYSSAAVTAEAPPSEQQLVEIDASIVQVEAWLLQASRQLPELQQKLQQVELRLAALTREIADTRASIRAGNARLSTLQSRQQDLLKQKNRQMDMVGQLLRAAYMEGSQNFLKLLLNQQDPAEAARMLYYYRLINADRMARIEDYEQTLTYLKNTETEIEDTNSKLNNESRQLARQVRDLEAERQTHRQAVASLLESIEQRDAQLQELQAARVALESLLEEVQQAVEAVPVQDGLQPFARRQGELPWPAEGPLLSRYGERYGNGELQRQGITIGAASGDPVRAVHGGRVVFANWLRGSGLLIILDHGDGYMSLYGHNETLTSEPGNWINAGKVIASAGSSGGQQQAGIYFEIRYNGRAMDPLDWLAPGNP